MVFEWLREQVFEREGWGGPEGLMEQAEGAILMEET